MLPAVHKVVQMMFIRASAGGCDQDLKCVSFSCLAFNEVSFTFKIVRCFFGHADVGACAVIEDRTAPECVEAAQKFKHLHDPERAILL